MKEYEDKLIEIWKQCTCNIFNTVRAAQILRIHEASFSLCLK